MKKQYQIKNSRRQFLNDSLKFGAFCMLATSPLLMTGCDPAAKKKEEKPAKTEPLKILILGGTRFLGPHQIAYALERGHQISTFTRGKTQPTVHADLFDQVESLIGDRENDLEALKGREWDVVIDNSGHNVKWAEDTANLLKDHVKMYVFTSSTGVYYPYLTEGITEEQNLLQEEPEEADEMDKLSFWYGVMKTNSENAVRTIFGEDRALLVRPTYMMGPGDNSDRFTYWPVRMAQGGEVVVPGKANDPVQYIDVRDVAEWMIRLIEANASGAFNAVGPESNTGMLNFVKEVQSAFDVPTTLTVIDDYDFLKQHGVYFSVPWIMPEDNNYGTAMISNVKALENGLTFRPLTTSVREIHTWWQSDAVSQERKDRMTSGEQSLMAKEKSLLEAWKSRV